MSNAPAVITVGDGRGFIVQGGHERFVITAGHCLPRFPPCTGGISSLEERTYGALLGPLGGRPTVCAECLFVDPIADIAVMGPPDNQALPTEAYEALLKAAVPFAISDAPEECPARLLGLDGQWFRCVVRHTGGPLWVSDAVIAPGMSGSPIVADDGSAIGVVCTGTEDRGDVHGPNARLAGNLPGWLLHLSRPFDIK